MDDIYDCMKSVVCRNTVVERTIDKKFKGDGCFGE